MERITPARAAELLQEGFSFLDVRTVEEFEAGHVPGAYNVPLMLRGDGGMEPNPEFAAQVAAFFAPEAPLILGCAAGVRSLKAASLLEGVGYSAIKELKTGWDGARDAFGRLTAGWYASGLPVEQGPAPGRSWLDAQRLRCPDGP